MGGSEKVYVNTELHAKPWPCASRVAGGGLLRLGQCTGPARTTQGRRVGGLQPKLRFLGVAGEFGDVVESAKNKRRVIRVGLTASLGGHHTMASARIAHRCRRRLAGRARMGGRKCTNPRRCKFLTGPPAQLRSGRVLSFGLGVENRSVYPAGTPPRSRGLDLAGARLALGRAWPARAREKGFC